MRVTFEIDTKTELETLTTLLNSLNVTDFKLVASNNEIYPYITKGNKNLNVNSLFGIWSNNPQTLENIRKKGFLRNKTVN